MVESLLLEDPFRHVATQELDRFAPSLLRFWSVRRVGQANSLVLRQQAGRGSSPAAASPEEERLVNEFLASCREAVSFAQQMAAGQVETPSAELLALARRAVERQQALEGEDVKTWAERLAKDVGLATD
jgi:hypothetical protein